MAILTVCEGVAFAAWDGYKGDAAEDSDTITIVDMNDLQTIMRTTASPSQEITGKAKYTAHYDNHAGRGNVIFENIPHDLTDVEWIELNIYSKAMTDAQIAFVMHSTHRSDDPGNSSYHSYGITLNWIGWKTFKLYPGQNFSCQNKARLNEVQKITFSTKAWGGTVHEDSDVYIDSIIGHKYDYEKPERDKKNLSAALEGAIVLYDNSRFAVSNNTQAPIVDGNFSARTFKVSGELFTPVDIFKNHAGAETLQNGSQYTITANGKTLILTENSTGYTANGEVKSFPVAPLLYNDLFYVPVKETFEAFGYTVKFYEDMVIMGDAEKLKVFDEQPDIVELCIDKVANHFPDPEKLDESSFDVLQARLKKNLVGNEVNDLSNPYVRALVEKNEKAGEASWALVNPPEKRDEIFAFFGDTPVTTTGGMSEQMLYVARMAKAWATHGSSLYHNEALLKDTLDACEWIYENLYGEDEKVNKGWRDIYEYNWWHWFKDAPRNLAYAFVSLDDAMPLEDKRKYLSFQKEVAFKTWHTGNDTAAAFSRMSSWYLYAIATKDPESMAQVAKDIHKALTPVTSSNGYREDYGYVYHGKFPYATGYGINLFVALTNIVNIISGTEYDVATRYKNNYVDYLYNTYWPIMRNARSMAMFDGRSLVTNPDTYPGVNTLVSMINGLGSFGMEDDKLLKQIIKSHINEDNMSYVFSYMNVDNMEKLMDILADDSIQTLDTHTDCRVYWSCDRVVQTRPDYSVGIALASRRLGNYESINSANHRGWYTSDGAVYVYNDAPEQQFTVDYFNYDTGVNWARYPGTTEDTQPRTESNIALSQTYRPEPAFSGGVQVDNDYAVVAMEFVDYHNETESTYEATEYGGGLPVHKSTLKAHKSWFLFDNEVVCLGTDINAKDGFPVFTTIDNRMLYDNGEVNGMEDVVIDEEMMPKIAGYTKTFNKAKWAYVETEGGYYFPKGATLTVNKTDAKPSFLEMWIEHGVSPKNQTYAYVILPNRSQKATADYARKPDIKLLSQNSEVHAVEETTLGIRGIIFWKAAQFAEFETDQALVMSVQETETEYIVKVSDPSQNLQSANILINKDLEFVSADNDIITVSKVGNKSNISFDLREMKGQTFTIRFLKK